MQLRSMGRASAAKSPSFDNALIPFTFTFSGDINHITLLKDLPTSNRVAQLKSVRVFNGKFFQVAKCSLSRFAHMSQQRFVHSLAFAFLKTYLQTAITLFFTAFFLNDNRRPSFYNGNGNQRSIVIKNLSNSKFFA